MDQPQVRKEFRKTTKGRAANDKRSANITENKTRNTSMKAFAAGSVKKAKFNYERKAQLEFMTAKLPTIAAKTELPPPDMVGIIGPKGSGKTTLAKSLIKQYSFRVVNSPVGPVTVSASATKRLQIFDTPSTLPAVLDIARVVDLIIICINANHGLETEIFEYLNILQAIGFPKVFVCVTHEDEAFHDKGKLRNRKKLRNRIEKEVFSGCKMFFLDFISNFYRSSQIQVMSRVIAQQNYTSPLKWKTHHGCVLVDRVERQVNGEIVCFGFVRGNYLSVNQKFHIPGFKDVEDVKMEKLEDPAMPDKKKILQKTKPILYAPMSEIQEMKVDQDGIHVRVNVVSNQRSLNVAQSLEGLAEGDDQGGIQLFDDGEVVNYNIDKQDDQSDEESDNSSGDEEESEDESIEDQKEALAFESTSEEMDFDDAELRMAAAANKLKVGKEDFSESAEESNNDFLGEKSEVAEEDFHEAHEGDEENEDNRFAVDNEGEGEEGIEEPEAVGADNQEARVKQLMSGLKLYKPQASAQRYHDIIYNYYKEPNAIQQSEAKKQIQKGNLMKLFDDEVQNNGIRVEILPNDYQVNYCKLPFQQNIRDVSKVFPVSTVLTKDTIATDEIPEYEQYFMTQDCDFADALNKIYRQEEVKADVQLAIPAKKIVNPVDKVELDGKFLDKQNEYVKKAQEREAKLFSDDRFLPGQYVRFVIAGAGKEFAENFNPSSPFILGGLLQNEEQQGFVTAKVKKHRWFERILKSRNPVVMCVGWRRFQTLPMYAIEQTGGNAGQFDNTLATETPPLRQLKYTPKHMHCAVQFYGWSVPTGTNLIAFQDVEANNFRVCLNGIVTEMGDQSMVYKKLKLVGYPQEIVRNTAVIRGMFTSKLEAAAFMGAGVRTVSGVRGLLKKPQDKAGDVRATFENQIRRSDVVFLKTFVKCKVDRFANAWDNHCGPFLTVKQIAEIRKQRNIPVKMKADSVYRPEAKPLIVKPDLTLTKKQVKGLPFEQAIQYVDGKKNTSGNANVDRKAKIKSKTLRALVDGERIDKQEEQVVKLKEMSEFMKAKRAAKAAKDAEWAEKYAAGVTKKAMQKKKARTDEEKSKKYSRLAQTQQKQLKRGKL